MRYEHNGAVTVLADKWNGKPLNAPNDVVVHPDGGIWFTDPGYGSMGNYEGNKGELEIKEAVYRIDAKTRQVEMVTDEIFKPNGLCFSPDYKKLYVADTGGGATRTGIQVCDVVDGKKLGGRPGVRVDGVPRQDGRRRRHPLPTWTATSGPAPAGSATATTACTSSRPTARASARSCCPRSARNVCFGGAKRNRLFMTASQSLYAVYVETQGAL